MLWYKSDGTEASIPMAQEYKLTEARTAQNLTQRELGLRVAVLARGQQTSRQYAQKQVSYWESGHARPQAKEITALSKILEKPPYEVESWFTKLPSSAEDLFLQLLRAPHPSLLVTCYSGRPRATFDPNARAALIAALKHNLFLAMVFPYPLEFDGIDTHNEDTEALLHFYKDVWLEVKSHWKQLSAELPADNRAQVKLYRPKIKGRANVFLPPVSNSRYTEVIRFPFESQISKQLYLWVEAEREGLHRLGEVGLRETYDPLLRTWDAYFFEITKAWTQTQQLPGDSLRWELYTAD
jgi:transcriptional regulator with XRE-family HTH domain